MRGGGGDALRGAGERAKTTKAGEEQGEEEDAEEGGDGQEEELVAEGIVREAEAVKLKVEQKEDRGEEAETAGGRGREGVGVGRWWRGCVGGSVHFGDFRANELRGLF